MCPGLSQSARFSVLLTEDRDRETEHWTRQLPRLLAPIGIDAITAGSGTPIRTFQNSDGDWCREYRQQSNLLGSIESRRAIACRSAAGDWENRLLALSEG